MPLMELSGQTSENNEDVVHQQLWLDFFPHFYINEKLEYYGDTGYRTILDENIWHRIHARPSVRYHLSKLWELHAGLGMFYYFNVFRTDRLEVSPWQGVRLNWPGFEKLKFNHLLRLEERFSFLTSNWSTEITFRLRYKLSGRLDVIVSGPESFWFIPFYAEIFIPVFDEIDEVFRNRGRAGVGLGFNESREWRFELLFNWQTSRSGPDEDLDVTDYICHLKIRRLWNFRGLMDVIF